MSFTHTHDFTIEAPADRVFRAFVEPSELTRWFAEDVQIEPRVGGVYRFWGRHTLGTPAHDAARQTVTQFEPDTTLGFSWPIHEVDTDVTVALAPTEQGTKLSITHQVSGDLKMPRAKAMIDDHWRLAIGNLMTHLAGGSVALPDYFDPAPEVRITMQLDAPPGVVFRALVEPERLDRWFGGKGSVVEPRVGGRYVLNWSHEIDGKVVADGPTRILEMVPDRKLVLDWPDYRGDKTVPDQTISFELAPDGKGGTTLTFAHAGFIRPTDVSDYGFGWPWFLGELKKDVGSG